MRSTEKKFTRVCYTICLIATLFFFIRVSDANAVRQYSMGSAGSQGYWYMINSLFAKVMSENVPDIRVTAVVSPGASTENIRRIHAREMEFALSTSPSSYMGFHGLDIFAPTKHDIMGWFTGMEMAYVIMVRADSGIKTIEDLKGKKIAFDKKGTSGYVQTTLMLECHGLKEGDYKEHTQSRGDGVSGFIDGRIDCWFFATVPYSTPHMTKMMAARKVRFLSLDKTKMKPFFDAYPYYVLKDYDNLRGVKQEKPHGWVKFAEHSIVGSYLDEDLVYKCTKAIFENIDQVHAASPNYKDWSLERALDGITIPVHPGALRYYKEKGVKGWDNKIFQYAPKN